MCYDRWSRNLLLTLAPLKIWTDAYYQSLLKNLFQNLYTEKIFWNILAVRKKALFSEKKAPQLQVYHAITLETFLALLHRYMKETGGSHMSKAGNLKLRFKRRKTTHHVWNSLTSKAQLHETKGVFINVLPYSSNDMNCAPFPKIKKKQFLLNISPTSAPSSIFVTSLYCKEQTERPRCRKQDVEKDTDNVVNLGSLIRKEKIAKPGLAQ